MKQLYILFVLALSVVATTGLNAQTITFEENSSEFNNRTITLTLEGQENGRNRYANRNVGDDFADVVIRWTGTRWVITDGNDMGGTAPGDAFVVYANDYDVGPNPPSFDQGNWEVVFAGEELVRLEGDGTQAVTLAWTLTTGPFATDAGVQTGLGGGTPTGGIYSGPGVTDDGNGMTFSFDPMAAGVGTATISYGAGDNTVTQTIEVTQGGDMINFSNSTGAVGTFPFVGEVNGRNSYSGGVTASAQTVTISWSGTRWEISGSTTGLLFFSNYDVSPNPPDFATGDWQNVVGTLVQLDGSGTQAVTLGFTLDAGPFATDAGVQTGLGGGTPAGGIYSGPGVTDDGNGMTFSFDPMAAGVGTATISYGAGDNNVTQTIEVEEPGPQIRLELTNDNQEIFSATLSQVDQVNGRNAYSGPSDTNSETVRVAWSGTRWEIFLGNGGNTVAFTSNYDVGPNPPDLATGNWNNLFPQILISFDRFDGDGNQAVELGLTLAVTSYTTEDGVQAGLSGGTPTGGIYSGPGVTDDGNGMTFSFDPAAAGSGMITISYGDGPDGANNATQMIEVLDATEVCFTEQLATNVPTTLQAGDPNFVIGQSFTACATGRLTSITVKTVNAVDGELTLDLNQGALTTGPDYSQTVNISGTGEQVFTLDGTFVLVKDSLYAFSLTQTDNLLSAPLNFEASTANPYAEGQYFEGLNIDALQTIATADLVFELRVAVDTTAVSTRPDLLTSVVNLTAFPNPTAGDFTVAYDLAEQSEVTVVLYDQQGRVLRKLAQGRQAVGTQRVTVTNQDLPAGVLYYGLQTERGHSAVKPIVVR